MNQRSTLLQVIRSLHLYVGLLSAFYFLLIVGTGFLLNHRERLELESHYINRGWLPDGYRASDGEQVRADIVLGDLHSGLIFGRVGSPILDVVAGLWTLSVLSGLSLAIAGRLRSRNGNGNGGRRGTR